MTRARDECQLLFPFYCAITTRRAVLFGRPSFSLFFFFFPSPSLINGLPAPACSTRDTDGAYVFYNLLSMTSSKAR